MEDNKTPVAVRGNWLLILGMLAMLLSAGLWLRGNLAQRAANRAMTLTGGSAAGQRHVLAERLVQELGDRIEVETTAGSLEALAAVDAGEHDLALVQGGLRTSGYANLRQVCALHVEPLHLLVRASLVDAVQQGLAALHGKRINISTPDSGTHALALGVLRFAHLADGVELEERSYSELLAIEQSEDLPDALFMVSSLPSPVARQLILQHGYRLVAIPFGNAFALDGLRRAPRSATSSPDGTADDVDQLHIYQVQIPAYTYGVSPAVPDEPVATLGTRLLLVAHKRVPEAGIYRVLEKLFASQFAQMMDPPVGEAHLELPAELPLHDGVRDYVARNRPMVSQQHWEWFEQTVNIVAVFATGVFSLWIWFRQRQTLQRELSFGHYLQQVAEVENEALHRETRAELKLHHLLPLQDRLRALKREALEAFGKGDLHGEELLTGFLTQVTDVRAYLTQLILHERDNLEELAREQERPFEEVWREAKAPPPDDSNPAS